jgi:hypothetical protein
VNVPATAVILPTASITLVIVRPVEYPPTEFVGISAISQRLLQSFVIPTRSQQEFPCV